MQEIGKPDAKYIRMATEAALKDDHRDDLGSRTPDYAVIYGTHPDGCLKGRWLVGFGFIDLHFHPETTREMAEDERAHYEGMRLALM